MVSMRKLMEDVLVGFGLVAVLAYSLKTNMLPLFMVNLSKKMNMKNVNH